MAEHLAVDEPDQILLHLLRERRLRAIYMWCGVGGWVGWAGGRTGGWMGGWVGWASRSVDGWGGAAGVRKTRGGGARPPHTHTYMTNIQLNEQTHLAAHLGLEGGDLLQDDAVLLLLGARLPDGLPFVFFLGGGGGGGGCFCEVGVRYTGTHGDWFSIIHTHPPRPEQQSKQIKQSKPPSMSLTTLTSSKKSPRGKCAPVMLSRLLARSAMAPAPALYAAACAAAASV